MRKEYDFSKGVRGKLFRKDAKFILPVYLDADNLSSTIDHPNQDAIATIIGTRRAPIRPATQFWQGTGSSALSYPE
jgi:hypothetical protein